MRNSKLVLVVSLLLAAMLFATNAFAATPTPTRRPTPTKTPIIIPTPTITPVPTISYRVNVHATNNSGQPANDLEIFFRGNVQVLDWWHDPLKCPFQSMTFWYDPVLDITIVRYYNGIVNPGQTADNCLFLNQNVQEYSLRKWSWDGVPTKPVGATLSVDFQPVVPPPPPGMTSKFSTQGVEPGVSAAKITVTNSPVDGGNETIAILQIGAANRPYSFAELTWENPILDQEVMWSFTLNNIHLMKGESISIPEVPMPAPAVGLVYRLKVFLDSEPFNVIEYVGQFIPQTVVNP